MESTTTLRRRFEDLVARAERDVTDNPQRYKLKLAALAVLGYAVIFCLLALLVLLLGGTIYAAMLSSAFLLILIKKKLIIVLVVAIWMLFKSLFVRIRAPDGLPLKRADFPELWAEIDDLRSQLKALPVHQVVMVPDMNAAVAQTPRLGLVGPHKNTLVLGLELLMTLSPRQARAVLAHEFGHLSGAHGRFGNWIYRKRLTWARIASAFDGQAGFGAAPMNRFIHWYVPRLAGYSFALARQQEYEADAMAAQLASREDAASALVLVNVRDEITREEYWKPLLQRAILDPRPEPRTFTGLYEHLKAARPNQALAQAKVAAAMREKTNYADTHPALRDRLQALGTWPSFGVGGEMAAERWLGARLGDVLAHFDAAWHDNNAEAWRNRNAYANEAIAHLKDLVARPADALTQMEAWQVAALTEQFMPALDALPAYKAYAQSYPDDMDGTFVIGRILLMDRKDAAGVAYLEAAAQSRAHREDACGLLSAYYRTQGEEEAAEHWLRESEAAYDDNAEARSERSDVVASDAYRRTSLDDDLLRGLAAAIRATSIGGKIKTIWIADKVLKHFPEKGVHAVLVDMPLFAWRKDEAGQTLANELQGMIDLPDTWFFVPAVSENRALAKKIRALGHSIG